MLILFKSIWFKSLTPNMSLSWFWRRESLVWSRRKYPNICHHLASEDAAIQNFAVQMMPQYHNAIVDLILHYDWRSIIYIFQSSEGMYRLQKIYENIPKVRKITNIFDAFRMGANDANANDVSLNLWNLTWKRSVDKTNTQFLFERWIKKIYLLGCYKFSLRSFLERSVFR